MKRKKLISLIVVCIMLVTLFAACNTGNDNGGTTSPGASSKSSAAPSEGTEDPEEIAEINFWMLMDTANSTEEMRGRIQDAINEISGPKIGVHVNITWVPAPDYSAQLQLAIANKETIDLALYNFMIPLAPLYSVGACMDITDYVEENGQDILNTLGSLINITKYNGSIYGMPVYRDLSSNAYLAFRTDALVASDSTELFNSMTTWAEYEEVLKAITEKAGLPALGGSSTPGVLEPGTLSIAGEKFSDAYFVDTLTDTMSIIACDSAGNVTLLLEDAGIVNSYKRLADWYKKGYIYSDSAYTNEDARAMMIAETYAGTIGAGQHGTEFTVSGVFGLELTARVFSNGFVNTTTPKLLGCFVPVSANEPAAAVKFYNLMYTDADIMNLIVYGIENENYVITADGEAAAPEGLTPTSAGYRQNEWWYGNNFLLYPVEGAGGTFNEYSLEAFKKSPVSPFLEVNVDLSDYSTLISAISAVKGEFMPIMLCGLYTDAYYNDYISKLKAAGIDEYIALFQSAVDEYR